MDKEIQHLNTNISKTETGSKVVQTNGGLTLIPKTQDDKIEYDLMRVALIVISSMNLFIKKSGLTSIGGLVQNYTLDEKGARPVKAMISSKGKANWKSVTASEMRSYADMINREFSIPSMKKDFSIVD